MITRDGNGDLKYLHQVLSTIPDNEHFYDPEIGGNVSVTDLGHNFHVSGDPNDIDFKGDYATTPIDAVTDPASNEIFIVYELRQVIYASGTFSPTEYGGGQVGALTNGIELFKKVGAQEIPMLTYPLKYNFQLANYGDLVFNNTATNPWAIAIKYCLARFGNVVVLDGRQGDQALLRLQDDMSVRFGQATDRHQFLLGGRKITIL